MSFAHPGRCDDECQHVLPENETRGHHHENAVYSFLNARKYFHTSSKS